MESKELLSCPFCDGKAELSQFSRSVYEIDCSHCHAGMSGFSSEDEAIATWNRRTVKVQPGGLVPIAEISALLANWDDLKAGDSMNVDAVHNWLARPNSSPVSAGDKDGRAMAMLVAEAAYKAGNGHDRAVASDALRQIVDGVFEQLGCAGVVDDRAAFEVCGVTVRRNEVGDWEYLSEGYGNDPDGWVACSDILGRFGRSGVDELLTAYAELQARVALSAPSHSGQVLAYISHGAPGEAHLGWAHLPIPAGFSRKIALIAAPSAGSQGGDS